MSFDSYEYKLVASVLIFYSILFFILGTFGIARAETLDYENVNVFTGVKALIQTGLDTGVFWTNTLFIILISMPLFVIITMMSMEYIASLIP